MAGDVEFIGLSELTAEFSYLGRWSRQRSYSIALEYGRRLVEEARKNASGRPGPNVITGDYVSSFYYEVTDRAADTDVEGDTGASVSAGTDAPQAMRLEYGFVGVDALGRHYAQPPFPHWGPAADTLEDEFVNDIADIAAFDIGTFERGAV